MKKILVLIMVLMIGLSGCTGNAFSDGLDWTECKMFYLLDDNGSYQDTENVKYRIYNKELFVTDGNEKIILNSNTYFICEVE
jgi:hypothetical protein